MANSQYIKSATMFGLSFNTEVRVLPAVTHALAEATIGLGFNCAVKVDTPVVIKGVSDCILIFESFSVARAEIPAEIVFTSSPWVSQTWPGPDAKSSFYPAPIATHIDSIAGRILFAVGQEVIFSEHGLPGVVDMVKNRLRYGSRVRMVRSVGEGFFVSDETAVYFVGGTNPDTWSHRKILNFPAFEWANSSHLVDPMLFGFETSQMSLLFATPEGVFLGLPSGSVFNLTNKRYELKKEYNSLTVRGKTEIILGGAEGGMHVQGAVGEVGSKAVSENSLQTRSILAVADQTYIAGFDGLYNLEKSIKSGKEKCFAFATTDFGNKNQKSINSAYLRLQGIGDYELLVMADRNGQWHSYPFEVKNEGMCEVRVKVGKGLVGRYMTLKVVSCACFEIEQIDLSIMISKFSRRRQ
ncbi:hypothetical protein [Desulfotalea psychrophila]|uniref:Uncharacterized protein n=1 Tax=Desulfotalea psychrophila (strain LSv54 / DSM 12343) TaxID=177439 RepID=Q6ALQ0_DESPS|nr:hypothetical protein [Desulfotalea psychrophila]CAG36725.1 unknown protein [Desulfotalea psychrophila LSv54]